MKRMFAAALLFSLVSTMSFAQSVLFRDDFNGSMQSGWTWTRGNPATWSLPANGLRIESEYGDLWQGWTNNCRNMLLRPAPSSDITIEAKLEVSLVAPINQAHILLYYNDDYYVRFGPVLSYGYQVVIDVVHEVGGGIAHQSAVSWGNNLVYLKIQKSGSSASCYYSSDGLNWTLHRTISNLNFSVDQVGLVAFDGSEPPSASVTTYDYFQISELPPPECVTPPSGLVSWWSGEDNANDIQNNNHGTLQNGATFATGKIGQAFSFDGVDDFVVIPHSMSLNPTNALSLEAWIYINQYTFIPAIVSKGNVGNYFESYSLAISDDGRLLFVLNRNGTSSGRSFVMGPIVSLNTWSHVASTYDGATMRVYLNGSEVGSVNHVGGIFVTPHPVVIGKNDREPNPLGYPTSYLSGLIDDVSIYNRALSASEIQSIYNAGGVGKCTECTPPEVSITGDDPVCPNSTQTYTATTDAANPAFAWSVAGGTINGDNTGSSVSVTAGGVGAMMVSVEVTDGTTNCSNTVTHEVTVEDAEAPVITPATNPIMLWPPNHKYVTINLSQCVAAVSDNCADLTAGNVMISKVTSDEPEDALGGGDGNTENDIVIAGDCQSVQLRSERLGSGNGRVYTIHLSLNDGNGNVGTATRLVTVPKSQNGNPAVDNGIAYEVMGDCNGISKLAGNDGSAIEQEALPGEYALFQNYPNPFNPTTEITFALPEASDVMLAIYNSSGQLVRLLASGQKAAGRHSLVWDAKDQFGVPVASGVYLYMLKAGNFVAQRKLVLMK